MSPGLDAPAAPLGYTLPGRTKSEKSMADETAPVAPRKAGSEWFWRLLAVLMAAVIGWVVWIAYQLNPPALVTTEAFEAAAKARATQNAEGKIGVAGSDAPAELPKPVESKDPPVNLEKLRLSDTLSTPLAPAAGAKGSADKSGAGNSAGR